MNIVSDPWFPGQFPIAGLISQGAPRRQNNASTFARMFVLLRVKALTFAHVLHWTVLQSNSCL